MFIWEGPDWPAFGWDRARLTNELAEVRHAQGRLLGRMEGLGFRLQELGRLDEAFTAYRRAIALDRRLLKPISKKITKARAGRLWLAPSRLRQALLSAS